MASYLRGYGVTLATAWRNGRVAIDANDIVAASAADLAALFEAVRGGGAIPLPVIRITSPANHRATLKTESRPGGAVIRLKLEDMTTALSVRLADLLRSCDLTPDQVDLVLDVGGVAGSTAGVLASITYPAYLAAVPTITKWRNVVLAAGAYPSTPTDSVPGLYEIPRVDRTAYRLLRAQPRTVVFGDYATSCPDTLPAMLPINGIVAKLVYATNDHWVHYRCTNLRKDGVATYRVACGHLIEQGYFSGPLYSAADRDFDACAKGLIVVKAPEAMKRLGLVRHMTLAADELGLRASASSSWPSPHGGRKPEAA